MSSPLDILVRNRQLEPRAGVLVDLWLANDSHHQQHTGADGVARFDIEDTAAVTVRVGGNSSIHLTRVAGVRVGRVAVMYQPPRDRDIDHPMAVMMSCPKSGNSVDTGLAVTCAKDLEKTEFTRNSVRCPVCGDVHFWSVRDARLDADDGEAPGLALQPMSGGVLQVSLVDRAGKPRPGVFVKVDVGRAISESAFSDATGVAQFEVRGGVMAAVKAEGSVRIVRLRVSSNGVQRIQMVR